MTRKERPYSWFSRKPLTWQQSRAMWRDLWLEASLDFPYLALIVSSCAIATFGLVANSAAVIIGAMIIAPLMLPIRSLAFGGLIGSWRLIRKSALAILVGTIIALAIAWFLGLLIGISEFGSEIQARSQPNLLDLGVAITAGAISGYAKIEPKISGTLAGTAIAVALMPPVCTIGLGLSQGNWILSLGATLLYITNLLGIALACLLVFLLAGYSSFHRARNALILTSILTAVLLIPLGISFATLANQARLERLIKKALLQRTVTFQRTELLESSINWLNQPPQVRLVVRTAESITPRQVELLQEFITKEMGRPFQLNVLVSKVNEVTSPE
ncbi:MAG: DUF389 domain-containing protein [Microcystis panniformis WG22]|nr:DUF389 domain-containing protein [Microcystis panniformis WG22]